MLKLNDITKSFGENKILESFSYDFENTGLYVIKGKSGIGKTTLLRIIAGLDQDHGGSVENGGIKNVSFMFQEYNLFPTLSLIDNVLLSLKKKNHVDEDRAISLLTYLAISDEDLKKKPRELSGGMKQRTAFVRALMKDAPILILDEPTKELDRPLVKKMMMLIAEEAKRRLVLLVTHDKLTFSPDDVKIIEL